MGFPVLNKLVLVGYGGVLLCSLVVLLVIKRFRMFVFESAILLKSKKFWKQQGLYILLFWVIGVSFFIHRPYLEGRFDLPERVNTLAVTETFWGTNPLTGEGMESVSAFQQWSKGVMPAWYLFFSNLLGLPIYRVLFQVVPLWTLSLCMSAYYVIAQILFDRDKKRVGYFMVFFTLFVLCGNGAYMNPAYGLLHYGYEEATLISNVILPCVFALVLGLIRKGITKGK